eukprot:s2868_g5.t1
MKEPAITGGLTASEQVTMWRNRIDTLSRVPWVFGPIQLTATDKGATWADVTAAKLVIGATGQFTLSIGEGTRYVELKAPTVYYGIRIAQKWTTFSRPTRTSRSSPPLSSASMTRLAGSVGA